MFLDNLKIHPSWYSFLTQEIKSELLQIENSVICTNFVPYTNEVLRILEQDLDSACVVWLGLDPYNSVDNNTGKPVANGFSFEPRNLSSWSERIKQISLMNIIKLVYASYSPEGEIIGFSEIREKIKEGEFPIKPPHQWFESLRNQGVLMANTYFTTEKGRAKAHAKLWQPFSSKMFRYMAARNPGLIWFLWGQDAYSQIDISGLAGINYMYSKHPRINSTEDPSDFLNSQCFKITANRINWLG